MTHNKINYVDVFRRNGHRITRQREIILDAICRAGGHATLGDVYRLAREQDGGIDRSTLYRTLDTFVKLDLVICAEDLDGERLYEIVQEQRHHHLVCRQCGAEVAIDNAVVDGFFAELGLVHGYAVEMDHLIVHGVCEGCSAHPHT